MKKIYAQHGDVLITKIPNLPDGIKKVKSFKGFIIERGEGIHTHVLEDVCDVYEKDGVMYLKVDIPTRINHEEHGIQTIEPGIYRKDMEQEFDYENEIERQVLD